MPIPGSGAISMSMFNTELGRASNTANSSLAGGSTPAVGSLFWLANQSGSLNQTAPHAMSEWYGYSAVTNYTVTFYARLDTINPPVFNPQFYISTDGTNFTLQGSTITNTTCTLKYTGTYANNTTVTVKIVDPGNTTVECRFGRALNSSTCPAVSTFTQASFTVTANRDTAYTVQAP